MSATGAFKSSRLKAIWKVIAVEVEGGGSRGFAPCQLLQTRRFEHEQEGAILVGVEHDRQQHAIVLGFGGRRGDEDGLAWIKARRVPGRDRAGLCIDLDDGIEKVAFGLDARAPEIAIRLARA